MQELTPKAIVRELDRYIIGQDKAKKCVAVALRNRYRRLRVPPPLRDEIAPKNILMIGPTGVGKTEIARRLAKLVNAPFIKVEATKYTEVGYVGRDVDSMVRDLVETAVRMVKQERTERVMDQARLLAQERILDLLAPETRGQVGSSGPLQALFRTPGGPSPDPRLEERRAILHQKLARQELEEELIELEVEDRTSPVLGVFGGTGLEELGLNLQDLLGGLVPRRKRRRKIKVSEARRLLAQEEAEKLIDMEEVVNAAIERVEQHGIIFIDEIDKIAGREGGYGPDVSREGVQRDILPLVEGCTVTTKYGPVRTDHVLFIAAGAFNLSKPQDLIPELQGRFPLRVELDSLREEDLRRILVEPENSLLRQYAALLESEGIRLTFTQGAVAQIAKIAYTVNCQSENIGARRLYTVMEQLLQDLLFEAPDVPASEVVVDEHYVETKLAGIVGDRDLSYYIL
ncbi:MAG: ATP-dependent protease ATPase subunit HslU [Moorellales bacterium]